MNVAGFTASADIVGRRVRVAWEFVPGAGETLADIPPVTLRRKLHDFAFASPAAADPFLVYAAASFPPDPVPGAVAVTDLEGWETDADGERLSHEPISVAVAAGGRFVEVLRRTTATAFDLNGVAVRRRVEIVDTGMLPGALLPGQVYYYQLFGVGMPASGDAALPYRSTAMVTDSYGLNKFLYQSLPEVYRRHDVVTRPPTPGQDSVPELTAGFGQLRRFVDLFGIAADALRGTAEGLLGLHDIDNLDARYLPQVAQWIGWDLSVGAEIPLRRNELKNATRLYALVGTLPGLRALVTQFTGWFTQVAEFAQNIAQSNQPARRNLFAVTQDIAGGTGWHGADDAAEALGFGQGNRLATGAGNAPASLSGSTSEPFALRPGMSLTLRVDGLVLVSVRFGPGDFAGIGQATAAEAAAAIGRALREVTATSVAGRVVITSETTGPQSLLEVVPEPTSLVSLDSAPSGRLAACTDALGRVRLFYGAWETPTRPASALNAGDSLWSGSLGNRALQGLRTKCRVDGSWRDSLPVFAPATAQQADPAAVALPDGRTWLAWLDDPLTAQTRLRWTLGTGRAALPARLLGQRSAPFTLVDGAVLTLVGEWPGTDRYVVHAVDFATLTQATAAELSAAMNKQLTRAVAVAEKNGSLSISSLASGAPARLAIDLARSTTARVLGFDSRNASGAPGSWDDTLDWAPAMSASPIRPGRHAETTAVLDPAGGVRVAWATHRDGSWRIDTAHWDDRVLAATAGGAFVRDGAGGWQAVAGLPSPDVRAAAVDLDGTAWFATASGAAQRHPDGSVAALTPALPSTDLRDVVLWPDGTAAFASAAGILLRAVDGSVVTLDTASDLPSNDVRALALAADGTLWAATAAGAVRRDAAGVLHVFAVPEIPSNSVRDVAVGDDGTAYLATAGGLAVLAGAGGLPVADPTGGLAAIDARAVAVASDGTVWVATPGGAARRGPAGGWAAFDRASGLASADASSVSVAADGTAWVGTAAGFSTIRPDGRIANIPLTGGADPAGRGVQAGWSAPRQVAGGAGACREPTLSVDAAGRTWLAWSQQAGIGLPDDNWRLHVRVHDPATRTWGADTPLNPAPPGGRAADRMPAIEPLPAGMRVFFSSDRGGGPSLWSVDVSLAGTFAANPVPLPATEASDVAPLAVVIDGGAQVIFRSDANVSLAQTGLAAPGGAVQRSVRVPDNGAVRRYAGTTAVDLGDLNRMRSRRVFGDMLSYTPNRPDTAGAPGPDELYTRGTVGLYVSRASAGAPLTGDDADRLRELLRRFVPINLRALVIVVDSADVELIDPTGTGLRDSYSDEYPFISLIGPVSDSSAVAMPGLDVLLANTLGRISANPADLGSLKHRTYFPPLQ